MIVARTVTYGGILAAALAVAGVAEAASSDQSWNTCRVGKPAASIAACTAVIEDDPERSTVERAIAFFNRGNGYFNQGNLAKAIDDYTRSIALNPDFAGSHFNRGNGYFNSGDLDHAIADYGEVLRIDPNYVNAYINRGNAHRKRGEFDAAFADYDAALKLDPQNALAKGNRA